MICKSSLNEQYWRVLNICSFLKHNVDDTLNAYPNSKLFLRYQATATKTWKAFSKTRNMLIMWQLIMIFFEQFFSFLNILMHNVPKWSNAL